MSFWNRLFRRSKAEPPRPPVPLSPETQRRVEALFSPQDRAAATAMLIEDCGNNLPFLEELDEIELERFRFAALKLSNGSLQELVRAIELAKFSNSRPKKLAGGRAARCRMR